MHSPPKAAFSRKFMMAFQVFLSLYLALQIYETRDRTARPANKMNTGFIINNDDVVILQLNKTCTCTTWSERFVLQLTRCNVKPVLHMYFLPALVFEQILHSNKYHSHLPQWQIIKSLRAAEADSDNQAVTIASPLCWASSIHLRYCLSPPCEF